MIFDSHIKEGNIKQCVSSGPSWSIATSVFCRRRIIFGNPPFSHSYQFMPYFHIIQDTNFRWYIWRNLLSNGNFEYFKKQPPRGVPRKRCSENMQQIYRRTPMPKCYFFKVALQLYWNSTSASVLSYKFAAYFQKTVF